MNAPVGRWMLMAASAIVAGTLIAAFMVMESPGQVREQRLDQHRITDLGRIDDAIGAWQRIHGTLPASLAELAAQPGVSLTIRDPVSGAAYDYEPGTGLKYRLCAVFATDTAKRDPQRDVFAYSDRKWPHPAGRHCFDRSIEPAKALVAP